MQASKGARVGAWWTGQQAGKKVRGEARSTGLVSLRHLLSHSGLGTEQRDGGHHGGHTVEQREGVYI
jgi:hypothetical protein